MNIETWPCHTTHSACNCVLERLNKLEKELEAAMEVIKTIEWMKGADEWCHGEDCEYWDYDEQKPSGKLCDCGINKTRDALTNLDEARQG